MHHKVRVLGHRNVAEGDDYLGVMLYEEQFQHCL